MIFQITIVRKQWSSYDPLNYDRENHVQSSKPESSDWTRIPEHKIKQAICSRCRIHQSRYRSCIQNLALELKLKPTPACTCRKPLWLPKPKVAETCRTINWFINHCSDWIIACGSVHVLVSMFNWLALLLLRIDRSIDLFAEWSIDRSIVR